MNTYKKLYPNVFVAKCEKQHKKGDVITVVTKYGKENEHVVHNLVHQGKDGSYYYSITRVDGYDMRERAKKNAEKYSSWAEARERKTDQYFEAAEEGKEFLALAEPIKVGHHSEKRHRALIARNHRRIEKAMENSKKADAHWDKAEAWRNRIKDINLSIPESLPYYKEKLQEAIEKHKFYKENPEKREHSYSLTYANNDVKKFRKLLETAEKLWG